MAFLPQSAIWLMMPAIGTYNAMTANHQRILINSFVQFGRVLNEAKCDLACAVAPFTEHLTQFEAGATQHRAPPDHLMRNSRHGSDANTANDRHVVLSIAQVPALRLADGANLVARSALVSLEMRAAEETAPSLLRLTKGGPLENAQLPTERTMSHGNIGSPPTIQQFRIGCPG